MTKQPWNNRYKIISQLNQGAQGSTHICEKIDDKSHQQLVLKILKNPNRKIRMETEANILQRLSHTNVVKIIEADFSGEKSFIVTELVEGKTLRALVEESRTIPVEEAFRITSELVDALAYIHNEGVYHRDIKPDNIVVTHEGKPILIDFGLAYDFEVADIQATNHSEQLGNRFLHLPELQATYGEPEGKRAAVSDVTLLIGLFFYMLSGEEPTHLIDANDGSMPHQRTKSRDTLKDRFDSPQLIRLHQLLNRGFEYVSKNRFQSAEELRQMLEFVRTGDMSDTTDKSAIDLLKELKASPEMGESVLAYSRLFDLVQGFDFMYEQIFRKIYRNNITWINRGREYLSVSEREAAVTLEHRCNFEPAIWDQIRYRIKKEGSEYSIYAKSEWIDAERLLISVSDEELTLADKFIPIQTAIANFLEIGIKERILERKMGTPE